MEIGVPPVVEPTAGVTDPTVTGDGTADAPARPRICANGIVPRNPARVAPRDGDGSGSLVRAQWQGIERRIVPCRERASDHVHLVESCVGRTRTRHHGHVADVWPQRHDLSAARTDDRTVKSDGATLHIRRALQAGRVNGRAVGTTTTYLHVLSFSQML